MKTYVFKLQSFKKNEILHEKINAAGIIWNHLVKLQIRHRSLFYSKDVKEVPEKWKRTLELIKNNKENNKYLSKPFSAYRVYNKLQGIRQKNKSQFGHTLNELFTRSIQNLTVRLEGAFNLFFTKLKRGERNLQPVRIKNPLCYTSFTLSTRGYKFTWAKQEVSIMGDRYKFHKDRIPTGEIKTVTIKRNVLGDIYLYVVSDESEIGKTRDPRPLIGIDVWFNTALTLSNGEKYEIPLFYNEKLNKLKALDRGLSKKRKNQKKIEAKSNELTQMSKRYQKQRKQRFRLFRSIANKRRDHHIKLARELALKYGTIAVPDVPIKRFMRHCHVGFKVNDLGYSIFLSFLKQQCLKIGTTLLKIPGRYQMVSTCHKCGYNCTLKKKLKSIWICPQCGTTHDRELNVAKNIEKAVLVNMI